MKGKSGSTNARACSVVVNWAKPKPLETPVERAAVEARGGERRRQCAVESRGVRRGKCL